ncbi:MAG: DUF4332 domain-containing protein [Candidatus Hodarchaeales archaeon]|jgi:hypothetical protein
MDEEAFQIFLKRGGRSRSAIKRAIAYVKEYEQYLRDHHGGKELDEASSQDLKAFTKWIEEKPETTAKVHLWAIRYYYEFTSNDELHDLAGKLREQRIKRKPYTLKKFRGVNLEHLEKLEIMGIENVEQMLKAGRTKSQRQELSNETGVPIDFILEFVKLSDLARISGLKSIRARLYHDAGVDTIEKLARWDPDELRKMLIEFIDRTGFEGIASLPKEAEYSVTKAKELPKIVEY